MISHNKLTSVLSKLNKETKKNEIKWDEPILYRNLQLNSSEELIGKIYATMFNDRHLWLFKINQQIQTDDFEFTWVPSYKLIVLDESQKIEWEFPYHRGIMDLYESVSYKVANMDSFFDSIKDDDNEEF